MTPRHAATLTRGLCLVLGAVFVCAAIPKLLRPGEFASAVANYRLLPLSWVNAAALTLPWWELLAAAAIQWRPWRGGGALVLAGLLTIFLCAIASAMLRGLDINCGCYGGESLRVGAVALLVDALLLGAAVFLLRRQ
jgi:hypothetical protein